MNKEIKKAIQDVQEEINYYSTSSHIYKQFDKIKNYIEELEKENKLLREQFDDLNKDWLVALDNFQQANNKLKRIEEVLKETMATAIIKSILEEDQDENKK